MIDELLTWTPSAAAEPFSLEEFFQQPEPKLKFKNGLVVAYADLPRYEQDADSRQELMASLAQTSQQETAYQGLTFLAVRSGLLELVKELTHGTDCAAWRDKLGRSLYYLALANLDPSREATLTIERLLTKQMGDLTQTTAFGQSLLHAALQNGEPSSLERLLSRSAGEKFSTEAFTNQNRAWRVKVSLAQFAFLATKQLLFQQKQRTGFLSREQLVQRLMDTQRSLEILSDYKIMPSLEELGASDWLIFMLMANSAFKMADLALAPPDKPDEDIPPAPSGSRLEWTNWFKTQLTKLCDARAWQNVEPANSLLLYLEKQLAAQLDAALSEANEETAQAYYLSSELAIETDSASWLKLLLTHYKPEFKQYFTPPKAFENLDPLEALLVRARQADNQEASELLTEFYAQANINLQNANMPQAPGGN